MHGQRYESRTLPLTNNDGLILFSDGLIEHRNGSGEYFDVECLADAVAPAIDERQAMRSIRGAARRFGRAFTDDVSLEALWVGAGPAPAMNIHFPPEPARIKAVRHAIEHVLKQAGLNDDETGDMIVAAGEALTNAVEHGPVPGADNTVEVHCRTLPSAVIVEVRSPKTGWSIPRTRARGSRGGHGFPLMRALTDDLTVAQEPEGTIVTLMKHRAAANPFPSS